MCAELILLARASSVVLIAPGGRLSRVRVASSFAARLIGLLSRTALEADEGLLLAPGGGIHTLGMRFAIDVIFLSAHFQVIKVAADVAASRWIFAPRRTAFVLEVRAGLATQLGLVDGVRLSLIANTAATAQDAS